MSALTLIIAVLGAGMGLSSVSRPWDAVAGIDKDRLRNARVLKKTAGLTWLIQHGLYHHYGYESYWEETTGRSPQTR